MRTQDTYKLEIQQQCYEKRNLITSAHFTQNILTARDDWIAAAEISYPLMRAYTKLLYRISDEE